MRRHSGTKQCPDTTLTHIRKRQTYRVTCKTNPTLEMSLPNSIDTLKGLHHGVTAYDLCRM